MPQARRTRRQANEQHQQAGATRGLNEWQRDELKKKKKKSGTMQNVLSAKARRDRVVADIIFDFATKPRLSGERGNAILVAASIYEACKYFTLFQKTQFKGCCALVTSYSPQARHVTLEETGANTETDKQFIHATYIDLLAGVAALPGMGATETYEEQAKALFKHEPAREAMVKQAMYTVLRDIGEVDRLFRIVFAHKEY